MLSESKMNSDSDQRSSFLWSSENGREGLLRPHDFLLQWSYFSCIFLGSQLSFVFDCPVEQSLFERRSSVTRLSFSMWQAYDRIFWMVGGQGIFGSKKSLGSMLKYSQIWKSIGIEGRAGRQGLDISNRTSEISTDSFLWFPGIGNQLTNPFFYESLIHILSANPHDSRPPF